MTKEQDTDVTEEKKNFAIEDEVKVTTNNNKIKDKVEKEKCLESKDRAMTLDATTNYKTRRGPSKYIIKIYKRNQRHRIVFKPSPIPKQTISGHCYLPRQLPKNNRKQNKRKSIKRKQRKLNKILECSRCSFKSTKKEIMIRHKELFHRKPTKYKCTECTFKTINKVMIKKHTRTLKHSKRNNAL